MEGVFQKLTSQEFVNFLQELDIIALLETWNRGDGPRLPGFDLVAARKASKFGTHIGRASGGILVYAKASKALKIEEINSKRSPHYIWIKASLRGKKCALCFVYNPPENSLYRDDQLFKKLENDLLEIYAEGDIQFHILMGDWNARCGELLDFEEGKDVIDSASEPGERQNADKIINKTGISLINFCILLGLRIVNGRTRGDSSGNFTYLSKAGASVVDFCLVSSDSMRMVDNFSVIDRVESSHHPIVLIWNELSFEKPNKSLDTSGLEKINRFVFREDCFEFVRKRLLEFRMHLTGCARAVFHESDVVPILPVDITREKNCVMGSVKEFNELLQLAFRPLLVKTKSNKRVKTRKTKCPKSAITYKRCLLYTSPSPRDS